MKDLLTCHLPKVGTKFIVTQEVKDTTFTPGTTAFMSFMREADVDYQDVARIRAVVIRRGKGGMDRINMNNMCIPIFRDPRMLEHDNYLPIEKRHYVHIEREPIEKASILELSDLDFLGWACAKSLSLHHITNNLAKKGAPRLWPKESTNPLAIACKFPEYFDNDKTSTIGHFSTNIPFREDLIREMRILESASVKCGVLYQKRVIAAVLNSAKFMVYTNENYFEVVDKEKAKNTLSYYEDRLKWIDGFVMKPVAKNK